MLKVCDTNITIATTVNCSIFSWRYHAATLYSIKSWSLQKHACFSRNKPIAWLLSVKLYKCSTDIILAYYDIINIRVIHLCTSSCSGDVYKSRFNSNTRKFSFSQRIINDWNSLPHDVVSAPNVFIVFLFNRHFDYA